MIAFINYQALCGSRGGIRRKGQWGHTGGRESWQGPSHSRPAVMYPGTLEMERGQVQGCLGNGMAGTGGLVGCGEEGLAGALGFSPG